MKFLYYDILFLIVSSIIVALFLRKNRKKLQREGILFLYRTKIGIKIIDTISRKYPKLIGVLSYASIISGYALMIGSLYFIWQLITLMANAVVLPKIPPIFPLIPYLPDIFKLDFLPPFYFTYWIITIALVAICHEFMHGVFARSAKIRLKSTGFGFLGPFLAAFVEMDEKQAAKKPVKSQLAILSGGSFANLILAVLFAGIINLFFFSLYSQSGVQFNTYSMDIINITNITSLNSIGISNANLEKISLAYKQLNLSDADEVRISAGKDYFTNYETLGMMLKTKNDLIVAYDDTPAYRNNLTGAIKEISYQDTKFRIFNESDLAAVLNNLGPGDKITITTTAAEYNLTLASNPKNSSKAYLGIGVIVSKSRLAWLLNFILANSNNPSTYYEPVLKGELGKLTVFIFNLLFWIVIINVSVMLVNMLPFGIFDGGRFFYLTVLGVTNSKKTAEKAFRMMNFIIMFLLFLLMAVWFFKII